MANLEMLVQQVEKLKSDLEDHTEEERYRDLETTNKLAVLTQKIDELTENVHTLLNLWEQARGMLTMIKWSAAIIGSLSSAYIFFKGK